MALLDQYEVGVDGPWTAREAAHLLRRAGFSATADEIAVAVGDGSQAAMEAAVDALVDVLPEDPHLDAPGGPGGWGGPIATLPSDDSLEGRTRNPMDIQSLNAHFYYRMFFTSQPLQEQFGLFLHDHFVSTLLRVDMVDRQYQGNLGAPRRAVGLLQNQNYLLRRIGLESFRETLLQITREPAMLIFLDNWTNGAGAGRAQENYAREIMELFTMGVDNYSEEDVREIAKCLTGETMPNYRDEGAPDAYDYGFRVGNHVAGNKSVFGIVVTEDFTGGETEQVIDLILSRVSVKPDVTGLAAPFNTLPASAVHMSWKILRWFLNQNLSLEPPDPIVLEMADYMRGNDSGAYPLRRFTYDFKASLRTLFLSKHFYDPDNFYAIVKTPADWVTSVLKSVQSTLGRAPEAITYNSDYSRTENPSRRLRTMGMELYNPLDVSGWRHGLAWINADYLLQRYEFIDAIIRRFTPEVEVDALNLVNGGFLDPTDPEGLVDFLLEEFLHDDVEIWAPGARQELINYAIDVANSTNNTTARFRNQMRGLMLLIMSLPVWQMK